jgi:hypothetical protein
MMMFRSSGDARFNPVRDSSGLLFRRSTPVQLSPDGYDLSRCALQNWLRTRLETEDVGKIHAVVVPKIDLQLVDLSTIALHKLGIDRAHLIATTKAHYSQTRMWAEALQAKVPHAHGLNWTSRRHDHEQAVMLFGDRLNPSDITIHGPSTPLLDDSLAVLPVINLAIHMGATLID